MQSPLSFPELPSAQPPVRWALSQRDAPPDEPVTEMLGTAAVNPKTRVNLQRIGAGFRLVYDDTGTFDVGADGRHLDWWPGPQPAEEAVRGDVLGRVLALALHAEGYLVLHGSAVVLERGAVAFVAAKHYGKSTLAMAMVSHGARLLTDDSLPIALGPPILACPGVHSIRLWEDALERLGGEAQSVTTEGPKRVVTDFPSSRLEHTAQPLLAVYLLAPQPLGESNPKPRRQRLPAVEATLALVRHAKLGPLLGGSEAPRLLDRAAAMAREAPVYALSFRDGFDHLPGVVDQLVEWSSADHRLRGGQSPPAGREQG